VRIGSLRAISWSAVATAAALLFAGSVLAHSGETFLVAEPATVAPGAGVAVRADLPTSGPVRLSLAGTDGSVREVGVVEQTDEGHFEILFQIPVDLPPGQWTLLAQADGAALASTTLQVAETPVGDGEGGQGGRDEDDPLLVALPSGWQASRSGPPAATSAAAGGTPEAVDIVPFVALGAAILALVALFGRARPRRPSGEPSDPSR
jgi:hypothetical protein